MYAHLDEFAAISRSCVPHFAGNKWQTINENMFENFGKQKLGEDV